jgi:hypothetical protein
MLYNNFLAIYFGIPFYLTNIFLTWKEYISIVNKSPFRYEIPLAVIAGKKGQKVFFRYSQHQTPFHLLVKPTIVLDLL